MAVSIGNLKAAQSIVGILERLAQSCTNKTNSTGEDPALQKNNEKKGHDVRLLPAIFDIVPLRAGQAHPGGKNSAYRA